MGTDAVVTDDKMMACSETAHGNLVAFITPASREADSSHLIEQTEYPMFY